MRIRSTKPEFWRSERIASVDWDARLVLKGLESYVDDNGVGKDDMALIVGDLFQRDLVREPSRTLARVSEAISHLSDAGLLWRYEADGTHLLYLAFWDSIQRVDKAQSGRFPRPDGTMNYKASVIRESVANIRESSRALAPVTGEQGNRGTGEQSSKARPAKPDTSEPDPWLFTAFWEQYPRKVRKEEARKAWAQMVKKADPDRIIAGVRRMATDPHLPDEQFIPHASRWLRASGWDDPPYPDRNGTTRRSTTDQRVGDALDLAERLAAQEQAQQRAQITKGA